MPLLPIVRAYKLKGFCLICCIYLQVFAKKGQRLLAPMLFCACLLRQGAPAPADSAKEEAEEAPSIQPGDTVTFALSSHAVSFNGCPSGGSLAFSAGDVRLCPLLLFTSLPSFVLCFVPDTLESNEQRVHQITSKSSSSSIQSKLLNVCRPGSRIKGHSQLNM